MRRYLSAAFCSLTLALPLRADILPEQVWGDWISVVRAEGGDLTAELGNQPGALVLRNMVLTGPSGIEVQIPQATLRRKTDRLVEVTLPESFDLVLRPARNPAVKDQPDRLVFKITAPGFLGQVAEVEDRKLDYGFRSDALSLALDRIEPALTGGQKLLFSAKAEDLALDWSERDQGGGILGKGLVQIGSLGVAMDYALTDAGSGRVSVDLTGGHARMEAFLTPDAMGSNAGMAPDKDLTALVTELAKGLRVEMSVGADRLTSAGDVIGADGMPARYDLQIADPGTIFSVAERGLDLHGFVGPGSAQLVGLDDAGKERDLMLTWQEMRSEFGFGLMRMTVQERWNLLLRLTDLGLSASLWSQLDPKAAMPRDPASLVLDLGGTFALDPVVLTPGGVPAEGEEMPLTEFSITLHELLLRLLGLEVTGTGEMALDFVSGPEVDPVTSGRIDLVTRGANALIEALQASGQVGADEIGQMRMGLMMMGKPGAEPDTLETGMEFRDGQIFLNGQRIQ